MRVLLPAISSMLLLGACGSKAAAPDAGGPHDADFRICTAPDAAPFMAGLVEASKSGAFTATLVSIASEDTPSVDGPVVGYATLGVAIVDAGGAAPVGLTITAEKPYMPIHRHSAATFPAVADAGGGMFTVSMVHFFMPGDFEVTLDLQPSGVSTDGSAPDAAAEAGAPGPAPAADKVVFPICVPG